MNNEPEDPNNNPWDDSQDSKPSQKPKKPESSEKQNPFQNPDNAIRFTRPKGSQSKDESPFENLFNQFKKSSEQFKGPGGTGRGFDGGGMPPMPVGINSKTLLLAGVVGVGLWLSSGIFRVQETDLAVVLRLGKVARIVGPGLQFRLPAPIEKEIIKNVSSNNVMTSTDRLAISKKADNFDQTLVLTGDENIIHISYTVTWKIKDLQQYLFTMRDPDVTILAATESIIREVIGQTDALSALTEERSAISQKASGLLQTVLDQYNIGVQIVQVQLQKVEPPSQVIDAFNDMQASLTDGDGLRIKAEAYRSEIVPKARGEASKITQEAEGYAQEVIARAQGEADRFKAVYTEYAKNPDVATKRLYLDAMEHVMSKASKTVVDPRSAPGIVPYVNLQSKPSAATTADTTQKGG
jgi:membrane protease subunit HflK